MSFGYSGGVNTSFGDSQLKPASLPRLQRSSAVSPDGIDPALVIWTIEDARTQQGIKEGSPNYSRPNMEKAVRRLDGTPVTSSEWKTIRAFGRQVIQQQLDPLPEPKAWDSNKPKTKQYYTAHHGKAWSEAVQSLEDKEVLLSYCAASWKAEQILMGLLQSQAAKKAKKTRHELADSISRSKDSRRKRAGSASAATKHTSKRHKSGTDTTSNSRGDGIEESGGSGGKHQMHSGCCFSHSHTLIRNPHRQ